MPGRAVEEVEILDALFDGGELIADAQGIDAVNDGDDKVVSVLGEGDVVYCDVAAELDPVVGFLVPAALAVLPGSRDLFVDNEISAVADIPFIYIAVGAANQRVVAVTSVNNFRKIRTNKIIVARIANHIHHMGVEEYVVDLSIREIEGFDSARLRAVAIILILNDDPLARRGHVNDEINAVARHVHIGEGDIRQIQPVAAAASVEDRILTVALTEGVDVGAAKAFEPVIAEPAVDPVGQEPAINDVVAVRAGDIDHMLSEFGVMPLRPIREFEVVDQVDEALEDAGQENIPEDDAILRPLHHHRDRVACAIAGEIKVGPGQPVVEYQPVVDLAGAEQIDALVAVIHDVEAIIGAEAIDVVAFTPDQQIVARAAVQRIRSQEAEDRILAIRLGVGEHFILYVFEVERGPVVKGKALNQRRCDVVDIEARIELAEEIAEVQDDAVELFLDDDALAVLLPVFIEEVDLKVVAFPVALENEVFFLDPVKELDEIDSRL